MSEYISNYDYAFLDREEAKNIYEREINRLRAQLKEAAQTINEQKEEIEGLKSSLHVEKEAVSGLRLVIQTIADELGCGDEPRCKWIMLEISDLKKSLEVKALNKGDSDGDK